MDAEVVGGNRATVANGLLAIPSVSIATDVGNLVDPATGVYVNVLQQGPDW